MVTLQLTIDANDPERLARFWALALGYDVAPPPDGHPTYRSWYLAVGVPAEELTDLGEEYADRLVDPAGQGPGIWFQLVPETKAGKNRIHLDVYPVGRDRTVPLAQRVAAVDARVEVLVAAGGTVIRREHGADRHTVLMGDPEGNEFCVA